MSGSAPAQPSDSVILSGFKGIRNTVAADRLAPDELERGQNIDLDDVGAVRSRRGYTLVAAGDFHSVYTVGGTTYGVKDGSLGIIRPDYTFETLQAGVGADPVAYVAVGDSVYFSSRAASGIIVDGTVDAWGAQVSPVEWHSPVINPTTTLGAIAGKSLGAPPMATALTAYNGRIYLAQGSTLWATELFLYRYVDKTRTFFQLEDEITVLGAVSDGVYVGTRSRLYFLAGNAFAEMRLEQVQMFGALPGSMVDLPADLILPNQSTTKAGLMVMTTGGLCACQDGGAVYNLTQTQVLFPEATSAAAMFRQQDGVNQYVGALNSAGTPTSSARIGDYVDAEIRRFTGASP